VGQPVTVRIAPSLLSADFSALRSEVEEVERGGADLIHLDIMDGNFVPNLTFGPPVVAALAPHCRVPLDAHLMVTDPDPLIPALAAAGVARIAVHVEACTHLHRTLAAIRSHGIAAGVALNPATPLCYAAEVQAWIDFVLVMTVNPGFGGQDFIPEGCARIRRLTDSCGRRPLDLTVDGGVGIANAGSLAAAGATTLVAGSAVFGVADRAGAIAALRAAAEEGAAP
jgi:ribulose-phosphate 3-epimerase